MAAESTQPDYGLDAPLLVKRMFTRVCVDGGDRRGGIPY